MQKLKILLAGFVGGLAISACAPQNSVDNTNNANLDESTGFSGIIGGTDVAAGASLTKSIVAIYDAYEKQLCTGSLLPNNIVLTAAHCVGQKPEAMVVIFDIKVGQKSQQLKVDYAEVSPYWEANQNKNANTGDIALLHFRGKIPTGYQPAALLPDVRFLKNGATVLLAGFGISNGVTREGAGTLRQTRVKISNVSYSVTEVALDQTQGHGACHGDSGGPAYITVAGKTFLWGVTSRGINDVNDDCSRYSAYTNAVIYKTWINKTSAKLLTKSNGMIDRFGQFIGLSE